MTKNSIISILAVTFLLGTSGSIYAADADSAHLMHPCKDDELIKSIVKPRTVARKNPGGSVDFYEGTNENGYYCEISVMVSFLGSRGRTLDFRVRSFYNSALSLNLKTAAKNSYCNGTNMVTVTDKVPMNFSNGAAGTDRTFNFTLDKDGFLKAVEAKYETYGVIENRSGSTVCTINKK